MKIKRTTLCGDCSGSGATKLEGIEHCSKCQGYGVVIGQQQVGMFMQQVKQYCPDCQGKGKKK